MLFERKASDKATTVVRMGWNEDLLRWMGMDG